MLDIQFIHNNKDFVIESARRKNIPVDIERLLVLDKQRRDRLQKIEELQAVRNSHAKWLAGEGGPSSEENVRKGREVKENIARYKAELEPLEKEFEELLASAPNVVAEGTPDGGEESNRPEKHWGDTQDKGFAVIDHLTWGESRGLIDFERGAKVAGNKFYFLKGSLAQLDLAVLQMGMQLAVKHGLTPMLVPHMVTTRIASGTGYLPRGEERQIYKIEGEDLNLIATAEMPITGYHADEILEEKELPLLYVGLSPSYRMEAGAYGKHAKGLYRIHQFNKLEMYVFCKPEDSEEWHQKLVAIEEELCQMLEIPYQLVRIAAGDLGAPAYKKFDIEYWSPVDKTYRELMSCSNVTDYQARRLNIRYRTADGKTAFVHTLNGTAAAMSRIPIALIENHQQADGTVRLPEALRSYMNGRAEL
jgi:seryl-tRNA synthetase